MQNFDIIFNWISIYIYIYIYITFNQDGNKIILKTYKGNHGNIIVF